MIFAGFCIARIRFVVKVLFVCLGNICRSPTAEGVLRQLLSEHGAGLDVAVDSAGTHAYHVGEPPDPRACEAAARRGIDITTLRGRQATLEDMHAFDYVLAMDQTNYRSLRRLAPAELHHKIRLFMEFAAERDESEVPDPYYGAGGGFDRVLDMIEDAARGLLADIHGRVGA